MCVMFELSAAIRRSPLFYVGDKFKLMPQLLAHLPQRVNRYYEPFVGGGTVFLNIEAAQYFLNDINRPLVDIHRYLVSCAEDVDEFFTRADALIGRYGLSCSYRRRGVPESMKKAFGKTYYARFNKSAYEQLRTHANQSREKNPLVFYLLLIYGFNRMLRFNRAGDFNLPVGNVDFNHNVAEALRDYFAFVRGRSICFTCRDFQSHLAAVELAADDFVYVDPPYLIAASEYNKGWGEREEKSLLRLLDAISERRGRFALSNVTHYNGRRNEGLNEWMRRYNVHEIASNYINYYNNGKKSIREVLVTNY